MGKKIGIREKVENVAISDKQGTRSIGLDLSNQLGFAIHDSEGTNKPSELCGMLQLKSSERESWAARFLRFKAFLNRIKPDIVFYEEVKQRFKSNAAATNYGGLVATLLSWCEEQKIPYVALDVGSIKRHATGKGNVGKDEMIVAANKRFDMELADEKKDSDVADALFILSLGLKQIYNINL